MVTSLHAIDRELAAILERVQSGNLTNRLSPLQIREETAVFRREVDEDQLAHGAPLDGPDWNLMMSDSDPDERAVFVITTFRPDTLTVAAGNGDRYEVIQTCEQFTLEEVDAFESAIAQLFPIDMNAVVIPRPLAQLWLGG